MVPPLAIFIDEVVGNLGLRECTVHSNQASRVCMPLIKTPLYTIYFC